MATRCAALPVPLAPAMVYIATSSAPSLVGNRVERCVVVWRGAGRASASVGSAQCPLLYPVEHRCETIETCSYWKRGDRTRGRLCAPSTTRETAVTACQRGANPSMRSNADPDQAVPRLAISSLDQGDAGLSGDHRPLVLWLPRTRAG